MKKILATIIKEWLLLRRDVAGLLLLLIMPAVLIIIMALVQDAPFRDYQEQKFDLLLANNDGGSLSKEIIAGLKGSKNFQVIEQVNGQPVTERVLQDLLQKGTYRVGIIIPKGATAEVINSSNVMANNLAEQLGLGKLPVREHRDSVHIRLYFDPVAKPAFRSAISFALDKYITYSCTNVLMQRIARLSKTNTDSAQHDADFKKIFAGIGIQEDVLNGKSIQMQHMNSTQHNVPAWAIFGMFFIVVPISGHMIREREEGSALRLKLIPHAQAGISFGRIFFNTIVCTVQFACMCAIGIWLLPLLGLSPLYLGLHPTALLPVVLAIAFVATAYGHFIGTFFKTTNQALPFGAISIVILAALGGILVPKDVLPPMMQQIAHASPLYWGLDGVNEIIIRDHNLPSVILHITVLWLLGLFLWGVSMLHQHFNQTLA